MKAEINNRQALGNANLGSRQPDAVGDIHGFEHVVDEPAQILVERGDRFGRPLQDRIREFDDRINHGTEGTFLKPAYLLQIALVVSFEFFG